MRCSVIQASITTAEGSMAEQRMNQNCVRDDLSHFSDRTFWKNRIHCGVRDSHWFFRPKQQTPHQTHKNECWVLFRHPGKLSFFSEFLYNPFPIHHNSIRNVNRAAPPLFHHYRVSTKTRAFPENHSTNVGHVCLSEVAFDQTSEKKCSSVQNAKCSSSRETNSLCSCGWASKLKPLLLVLLATGSSFRRVRRFLVEKTQ